MIQVSAANSPWRAQGPAWTWGHAAARFVRHHNAWILLGALAVTAVGRASAGAIGWADLVVAAAFVAFQPFQEWLIHVYILHWRPRRVGGITIDFELARRHRHHHTDPGDLRVGFMPTQTLVLAGLGHALAWPLLMPTDSLAWTALLMVATVGLVYEWTHFVIHTSVVPRNAWVQRVFRYHRLHHFKNENYWMGVTMHLGDRLLGTLADQRAVPASPTARDLAKAVGAAPTDVRVA